MDVLRSTAIFAAQRSCALQHTAGFQKIRRELHHVCINGRKGEPLVCQTMFEMLLGEFSKHYVMDVKLVAVALRYMKKPAGKKSLTLIKQF